jgi:nucleoside-diphosphate-sugar epimerase
MDFQTNHVLLTGAAGWLGTGLLHAMAAGLSDHPDLAASQPGLKIRAMVMPGQTLPEPPPAQGGVSIELIEGDVRNPADCRKLTDRAEGAVLIHTASVIHPQRACDFYEINAQGAKNLLDAAAGAKVRRFVHVSSNSPLGLNPHPDHLFDEQSPYHPYMGYGKSKMMQEVEIRRRETAGELETVIIRAPWFYGPYQPPRQTLFFKMIRDGKAPIVGSGNNLRSMAYIDNLCQGILLAATRPDARGQIFWIADERPYSMNEIIDTVEKLLESEFNIPCKHKRRRLPNLASGVAVLMDRMLQSIGKYSQMIHVLGEMNKTIACTVEKAKQQLGYRPAVALQEGMRRSIRWVKDRGQL